MALSHSLSIYLVERLVVPEGHLFRLLEPRPDLPSDLVVVAPNGAEISTASALGHYISFYDTEVARETPT